ncbi:MAG: hypothetical protein M1426_04745 [Patescibacteria group bacterium]|nr:hypothetical protein [Patescibacteria group bacterium]
MKKQIILFVLSLIVITFLIPQKASADSLASGSSANINRIAITQSNGNDYRVKILHDYLARENSPLATYAAEFVSTADKYNLDWRLVAAISGVESTFGKEIPAASYNAWGWGVYGDNVIRFSSWKDGIDTISQGLRDRYMNQWGGKDIYQIGSMYAASPAWAGHVVYYMDNIQNYGLRKPTDLLSLSL